MSELAAWNNFYMVVGSAAGALIGLQFVVMTLIANRPSARLERQAADAFATPSVVHFAVVLLVSALVSAPWLTLDVVALLWGVVGIGGLSYAIIVTWRMRFQTAYRPVFEDWVFHAVLPIVSYAMLAGSAFAAHAYPRRVLFIVGAAVLLLLFVGIHNAWDAVTYHLTTRNKNQEPAEPRF